MSLEQFRETHGTNMDSFMREVMNDKVLSSRYGREFGQLLHMKKHEASVLAAMPEIRGPLLYWNKINNKLSREQGWVEHNVLDQHAQLEGWKEMNDTTAIFGTSNCRADSSEILKMLAVSEALIQSGVPEARARTLYFIDPCAHHTGELLHDMADDLGQEAKTLYAEMPLVPRADIAIPDSQMAANYQLPPYFYQTPDIDDIRKLDLPVPIRDLMLHTAEITRDQDFGSMRILMDKMLIEQHLRKLGYEQSLIHVVSFEDILASHRDITVGEIADRAQHAWNTYRPEIFKDDKGAKPPVILRYMWGGKRININAVLQPFEGDRLNDRQLIEDDEIKAFTSQLDTMSLHELVTTRPTNLGGVGYAMACGLLAEHDKQNNPEYDQDKPLAMFQVDHYTLPYNMGIAGMEVMRGKGLNAMWITKGTEGRVLPNGKEDYWAPRDKYTDLLRPDSSIEADKEMIGLMADQLRHNDAHTHSGYYYDTRTKQQSTSKLVPVPSKTVRFIQGEGTPLENRMNIKLKKMDRKNAWRLVEGASSLTPEKVSSTIMRVNPELASTKESVSIRIGSAKEQQAALAAFYYIKDQLGFGQYADKQLLDAIEQELIMVHTAAQRGEELADTLQNIFTEEDWRNYWQNRIEAIREESVDLHMNIPIPDTNGMSSAEIHKAGDSIYAPMEEAFYKNLKQEIILQRPDYLMQLNTNLQQINALNQSFESIRSVTGMLMKYQQDPVTHDRLLPTIVTKLNNIGYQIGEGDPLPPIEEVQQLLEANKKQMEDSIPQFIKEMSSMVKTEIPETVKKQKKYEEGMLDDSKEYRVFNEKGNVSDTCNIKLIYARHVLGYINKMTDIATFLPQEAADIATLFNKLGTNTTLQLDNETMQRIDVLSEEIETMIIQRAKTATEAANTRIKMAWERKNQSAANNTAEDEEDSTILTYKIRLKHTIADQVYNEVTTVINETVKNLGKLYPQFMAEYTTWRESMRAAIAEQGFTYKQ